MRSTRKRYHGGHEGDTRQRTSRLFSYKASPCPPFMSVSSVVKPFQVWRRNRGGLEEKSGGAYGEPAGKWRSPIGSRNARRGVSGNLQHLFLAQIGDGRLHQRSPHPLPSALLHVIKLADDIAGLTTRNGGYGTKALQVRAMTDP